MSFKNIDKFEKIISNFFGSKYGVAVDSCTHAIELCLRIKKIKNKIFFPRRTYIGIPLTAIKLDLNWGWEDLEWEDFYYIKNTNIIDAAVLWKENAYIQGSLMCLSFQYQKHLNIGRGGMILTNNKSYYNTLKLLSYDGRKRDIPWRSQNISLLGFHYYMTPENAKRGIELFRNNFNKKPKKWSHNDYPDLSRMRVFNK